MADNKYIYVVARIRALELGLLSDSFIEQLIASPDVQSAQRLLNEKGWDENLTSEEEKIWKTMKELGVDMKVFDVLTLPNLYHNLKAAIKEVTSPDKHSAAFFKGTEYDEERINKIIESKDYKEEILTFNKLATKLREKRMAAGSINFHSEEVKFILDENKKPIDTYIREQNESHELIEDFMLLANRTVAETFGSKQSKWKNHTFVFRVHDEPNPDKLNAFTRVCTCCTAVFA